jgi:hypothetical protein
MKVTLMMDAVIDHDGYTIRGTLSQIVESNSGGVDEPASYEPVGEASVEIITVQAYDEVNQRTDLIQVSTLSSEETKVIEQKLRDYASAHFDEYDEEEFYNELADADDEDEDYDLLDDDDEELEITDEEDEYLDDDLLDDEDEDE